MKITILSVAFALIAIFSHTKTTAQQSYSCQFLNLISDASILQNQLYKQYLSPANKNKKLVFYSPYMGIDSGYVKKKSTAPYIPSVFDDSIFHMSDKILLIDTFRFFDKSCMFNENQNIQIIYDIKDTLYYLKEYEDIVMLKSIRCFDRYFIIALQHINSTAEPHFFFNLKANYPPVLDYIRYELGSGQPLRKLWMRNSSR
ncbi:MAG: hypothetical protein EOO44_20555 [Flavobacterium sp.]|nr:MAG: hypothetical protein EOO44_20555 [Flavobacterium sp.]